MTRLRSVQRPEPRRCERVGRRLRSPQLVEARQRSRRTRRPVRRPARRPGAPRSSARRSARPAWRRPRGRPSAAMRWCASLTSRFCSGIGSGSGAPGSAQASVHLRLEQPGRLAAVDPRRAPSGPSRPRRARAASRRPSPSVYSEVVSQYEPIHTPPAPSASAAAICRPEPMPPAASTAASSPTASTISGTSTIVAISPVWPPASVPWAMTMSTPLSTCERACLALPASAATGTPCSCAWSMTSFGGEPSALAISLIGCLQRDVDVRAGDRVQPAEHAVARRVAVGRAAAARRACAGCRRRTCGGRRG